MAGTCLAQTFPPLPEGNTGIASRYPNDAGIAGDTDVIFSDDFESYADSSGLSATWNGGVYHNVRLATEKDHVFAGSKSVEFTLPQQTIEWSNTVARDLDKSHELTLLFLRAYTKFDTTFDVVGSSHNGIGMSAHYFINDQATPGVPSNGYNKFLMEFESWRGTAADTSPGSLNVYIYHPGQRSQWGDHFFPDGEVMPNTSIPYDFGSGFVARPWITCKLGRWYCVELMVKANTVGQSDGRVACWLDGKLIADFQNLVLRYVDSLKINRFNLSLHAGSNPTRQTYKWYDNAVAAKSYIGPMSSAGPVKNHLNPATGSCLPSVSGTTIYFSLAQAIPVRVDIFTMRGALVRNLVGGTFSSGSHGTRWDGRNGSGVPVAAGMYIAMIRIADRTWTAKMSIAL
ncbi:MAG TPA: FlgD immunoglobulin-like domain containing protein [Chitinivibrionales bacterium]|nr:FlgD immunoglobulin-like domain containing protein [Chitinivibrionales bacterium]